MKAEVWRDTKCLLGEGPLWLGELQALVWVDIMRGQVLRSPWPEGEVTIVDSGTQVGGVTVQEDGSLLLFREAGAIELLTPQGKRPLRSSLPGETQSRFNDVAADPEGRVFCGTMPSPRGPGRLYRLDPNGTIRVVLDGIGCSNGIGWSPDLRTMYYTDTGVNTIWAFDYDPDTGEIEHRRPFFVQDGQGAVDGMTVDTDGCVWSALWGGWGVIKIDPAGELMGKIELPAERCTCPTFGGPDFATLFVTSAGGDARPESGTFGGAVFAIDSMTHGRPEFRSRVAVP